MKRNQDKFNSIKMIFAFSNHEINSTNDIVKAAQTMQKSNSRNLAITLAIQSLCEATGPEITGTNLINVGKKLIRLLPEEEKLQAAQTICDRMQSLSYPKASVKSLIAIPKIDS